MEPLTISEHRPWLLQQFLSGPEYSSYTIVHDGRLVAHCDNLAEASCLNYAHVGSAQARYAHWLVTLAQRPCVMLVRNNPGDMLSCNHGVPCCFRSCGGSRMPARTRFGPGKSVSTSWRAAMATTACTA